MSDLDFVQTAHGSYYIPTFLHRDVIKDNIKNGIIFEKEIVDVAKEYIKEGDVVLDIGANLGQMSILFSKMCGKTGMVYSFEAQEFIFSILVKNINANDIQNIIPFYGAVYDDTKSEVIFPSHHMDRSYGSYGAFGLKPTKDPSNGDVVVKTITIDSLDIQKKIGFMKIDIQGCDLLAMKGAKKTILRNKMPIIFEYEEQFQDFFKTSFSDYEEFVESIDYKFEKTILDINYLILPK